jgi:hypothetical protein
MYLEKGKDFWNTINISFMLYNVQLLFQLKLKWVPRGWLLSYTVVLVNDAVTRVHAIVAKGREASERARDETLLTEQGRESHDYDGSYYACSKL